MAKDQDLQHYKLKLTGGGLSLDRSVSEAVARQVMALVMGGPAGISGSPEETTHIGSAHAPHHGSDSSTPKAFMAGKQPRNEIERITCLAYFLTHSRGTPLFKTRELTDLNIEAAQPKLSNASYVARNATQANYLSLAGKGQKQITVKGEALVEALPDRGKVRAALETHPIKRRKKTKRASGKK